MAQAYTPGLKVTNRTTHRARRILPIAGEVRVKKGDKVNSRDIVAEAFMPGDVNPLNMSNLLSMPPADVHECMLKKEGDPVKVGEPLARTKGIFGMFRTEYKSKVEGTLETVSDVTGQVIIRGAPQPVQVLAYLTGDIVEVLPNEGVIIETEAVFIQGIFGIGGEAYGPIRMACKSHDQELTSELITADMKDAIIVGGARVTDEALEKAVKVGAAAIIAGGMDDQDLRDFLGYDLGVAITGSEQVGLTVVITEGFGDIHMAERTFKLLASHEGDDASVNGATQIRAGVMRPEIVIPLTKEQLVDEQESTFEPGQLTIGRSVRVIRDPYFGLIGSVNDLPSDPHVLGSGSKARVLEVKFDSGETALIPRANVELIEG
jgi:hypothetical protein